MMNHEEQQYLDLLRDILDGGVLKNNRTGTLTKFVFGRMMRFNLRESFPILTTKKVFLRGVFEELMLFLRGDTNSKHLEEKGIDIWKGNTSRDFLDGLGLTYLPEGEMGCSYPHQWRNYGGEHPLIPETKGCKGIDQISKILYQIKNNPLDRRIYLVGVNPAQERFMSLPCCHNYAQFIVNPNTKELNCLFSMRSNDIFLGFPFNLCQYGLLTIILAKATGCVPNELVYVGVDVHLYHNHFEAAAEQISRSPRPFPKLEIKKCLNDLNDIESLQYSDIELLGYNPYPTIKAKMAI